MILPAQVGLPSSQAPSKGSLWDSIFGPVMPLLSGAWWFAIHLFMPFALIAGVVGMIVAGVFGSRPMYVRFRGVLLGIPITLFWVGVAILVANWMINSYGVPG